MAFLDVANTSQHMGFAREIREAIDRVRRDGGRGDDLIEVTVRYVRMTTTRYAESPFVVPRSVLPKVYQLAKAYQHPRDYPVLHADAITGNAGHSKRAFFQNEETWIIEVVYRNAEPELNDEDIRRRNMHSGQ
jgi:hypothetical protein